MPTRSAISFQVRPCAKLKDLLRGSRMSGSTAPTNCDAGTTKLLAHRGLGNAQLGTDLAQSPPLGVQIGCTLNVHGATVTSRSAASGGSGCGGVPVTPAMRSSADGR
jgi:hypothetical protein